MSLVFIVVDVYEARSNALAFLYLFDGVLVINFAETMAWWIFKGHPGDAQESIFSS